MKATILYTLSLLAVILFPSKFFLFMFLLSTLALMLAVWDSSNLSARELWKVMGCSDLYNLLKSMHYGTKDN